MKKQKKILPFILYFFIFPLLFSCNNSKKINEPKYQHYVGYINQEKAIINSGFLCNKENIEYTHHGAAPIAYKGSKKNFKNTILSKYNHKLYKDSGYISFRFLVNCNGDAGWFEVAEMNLDLEEVNLDDKMVDELLNLTSEKENWNKLGYSKEQKFDYYMYIIYRIENGNITEILP